jgi:hypothetical protein
LQSRCVGATFWVHFDIVYPVKQQFADWAQSRSKSLKRKLFGWRICQHQDAGLKKLLDGPYRVHPVRQKRRKVKIPRRVVIAPGTPFGLIAYMISL